MYVLSHSKSQQSNHTGTSRLPLPLDEHQVLTTHSLPPHALRQRLRCTQALQAAPIDCSQLFHPAHQSRQQRVTRSREGRKSACCVLGNLQSTCTHHQTACIAVSIQCTIFLALLPFSQLAVELSSSGLELCNGSFPMHLRWCMSPELLTLSVIYCAREHEGLSTSSYR